MSSSVSASLIRTQRNARLATYCPFCQNVRLELEPRPGEASAPLPPPYTADDPHALEPIVSRTPPPPSQPAHAQLAEPDDPPPSYHGKPTLPSPPLSDPHILQVESAAGQMAAGSPESDIVHFLHPTDTIQSLSLAYGVPSSVLRSSNQLHSDHLISARRTIKIPSSHYEGDSLSPTPVEGEEESERKARLRRFMVRCKCADYKIASLYLEEHGWVLDTAVEKWQEDERWEKYNPMPKGKAIRRPK